MVVGLNEILPVICPNSTIKNLDMERCRWVDGLENNNNRIVVKSIGTGHKKVADAIAEPSLFEDNNDGWNYTD